MANALEQSFADICTKHDLLNASISFHPADDTVHTFFSVSLQWGASGCAIEHGPDIATAFAKAVAKMQERRTAEVDAFFADEPLIGEAA